MFCSGGLLDMAVQSNLTELASHLTSQQITTDNRYIICGFVFHRFANTCLCVYVYLGAKPDGDHPIPRSSTQRGLLERMRGCLSQPAACAGRQ